MHNDICLSLNRKPHILYGVIGVAACFAAPQTRDMIRMAISANGTYNSTSNLSPVCEPWGNLEYMRGASLNPDLAAAGLKVLLRFDGL